MIRVRVVEVGGAFEEVKLEEGSTVRVALEAAKANINTSKQLRIGDREVSLTDIVHDGETVFVTPNIKGNA